MATRLDPADRLRKLFQRRMCWMIGELAEALGCALISVRRLLKQVGYFHSYTHNGKFYTLESVPRFNPEGIWRHRGIGFSKQGSLIATLIYLIGRSRAGLSAKELAEKLEHPCHALLTNLYKNGQLDRIKVAGQFRYLGVEPRLNHRQRAQAQAAWAPTPPAALSTQAALLVLVEHVKNPSLSFEQIASSVQKHRQMAVAPESIRRFFEEQGLKKNDRNIEPKTLDTLQNYMQRAIRESSGPVLFAQPPTLPFRPTRTRCPQCRALLKVRKTELKTLHTLHLGPFRAHETLLHCQNCENQTVYHAEQLRRLVSSGCSFGYDVLVFVGKALFLRHRRSEEIVEELLGYNVRISPSEVEYLGKKFVVYLALAHRKAAPRLKKAMRGKGGYILHLDGTCDRQEPVLMSSLDSISKIVLGSVKVPSEKAEYIVPFLQEIKKRFGIPVAIVHDMGSGILAAVKKVFPQIPDLICHFHFLRDLGKDLLEKDYDAIRKRLRHHQIASKLRQHARRLKISIDEHSGCMESFLEALQSGALPSKHIDALPLLSAYTLIQWALQAKKQANGYGFPFDRLHVQFAKRLRIVYSQLESINHVHLRGQWRDNIPLFKLSCELKKVCSDRGLQRRLDEIDAKTKVFDQLREAMRIAPLDGSEALNSASRDAEIGPIKKAVTKFRQRITAAPGYPDNAEFNKMIEQIDKYWDKLFADPILVESSNGQLLIQPQRTNNLMERFFRDFRRGARRKSGYNSINKTLQCMIADTPLVKNLQNSHYMKILLNSHDSLEECFAQIDITEVRQQLDAAKASIEKVPPEIKKLLDNPAILDTVCFLFKKCA